MEVRILDTQFGDMPLFDKSRYIRVKKSEPSQHYKVFKGSGKLSIFLDRDAVVCDATPYALVNYLPQMILFFGIGPLVSPLVPF